MKTIQLTYTLGSGGGEKFLVNLSNELAKEGNDVTIMQLRCDSVEQDVFFSRQYVSPEVHYINLGLTKGYSLKKAMKVMRAIKKQKPDIVHLHLNLVPYILPLALFSKAIKFVYTIHNVANKETGSKILQKLNQWMFRTGRITPVSISEECQRTYVDLYHLPVPVCIDNGCPPIPTTANLESTRAQIECFRVSKDTKVFLHVAHVGEAKNQQMLIDSFNQLIQDGFDVVLLCIGAGYDAPQWKHLIKSAGPHIHFLGTKNNIGDYLHFSDFFILSSLWEGLPISLIEAMSIGVTPITTPAGGIINVIKDGENGFLSKDFAQQSFVDTIKRALTAPLVREKIISDYRSSFSIEACASRYIEVYNNC